jgi:glycine/D-amino acid oxidase-like deaminating enzyme
LDANLAMQRRLKIDVRVVSAQELAEIDANARLGDEEAAAFEAEAGYVESVQVIASFAEAARNRGADIHEGVEVTAVLREGEKITGVETNEGRYETNNVILATGPWAERLSKQIGLALPVQACRTQVALFRRPVNMNRRGVVYGDFVHGIYFKPTHGDMVHVGSVAGEEVYDPVDADEYNEAADPKFLPLMRQRLCRRYPAMHKGYGRGGYGALYAITPDWHPILDRLPGLQSVYCAVGFSGHGFKMSPIVGQLMTELILDGKASTLDAAALSLTRFTSGDLIKSAYTYGVMG